MGRGHRDECPVIGQDPFAPPECVLDQHRRSQVRVNANGEETVLDEGEVFARNGGAFDGHIRKIPSSALACNLSVFRSKDWAASGMLPLPSRDPGR